MKRKKDRCYLIFEKKTNMLYGAFPYTSEGEEKAKKYLKKINNKLDEYEIRES